MPPKARGTRTRTALQTKQQQGSEEEQGEGKPPNTESCKPAAAKRNRTARGGSDGVHAESKASVKLAGIRTATAAKAEAQASEAVPSSETASKGKKATRGKKAAKKEGGGKMASSAGGRKRRQKAKAAGIVVETYYEYTCSM